MIEQTEENTGLRIKKVEIDRIMGAGIKKG
jgi:hypothetical protein